MPSAFDPNAIWVSGQNVRKVAADPGSTTPIRDTSTGLGRVKTELDSLMAGVEGAGGSANSGTAITINAATFGDSMDYFLICTAATAVAVTLAADVPTKKTLHVMRKAAGNVTVDDNGTTSNLLTGAAVTTALYDSFVFRSLGSGEWIRMQTA